MALVGNAPALVPHRGRQLPRLMVTQFNGTYVSQQTSLSQHVLIEGFGKIWNELEVSEMKHLT